MSNTSNYIDREDGLKRLGGNTPLYKRLIQSFIASNNLVELEELMRAGDAEGAAKSAHALKGVTANLSLTRLNELTVALEKELKGGNIPLEYIDWLDEAFEGVQDEVGSM